MIAPVAVDARLERDIPRAFAQDALRVGALLLAATVVLGSLAQSFIPAGGIASRAAFESAKLSEVLGFGLVVVAALLRSVATGASTRLVVAGAFLLAAIAGTVTALRGSAAVGGTQWVMVVAALGAVLGASSTDDVTRLVAAVLRLPLYASLAVIAAGLPAGRSSLSDRFFDVGEGVRYRGIFNHPVAMSSFALLFAVATLASDARLRMRVVDLVVAVTLVVLSDTRSGLIGLGVVAVLVLAARHAVVRNRRLPRLFVSGLPLVLLGAQVGLSWWASRRAAELAATTSWRSVIWNWCWSSVQTHPVGGGDISLFAGHRNAGVLWWHCHNEALTTMYTLGVPGFAALAVVVVGLTVFAAREARRANYVPWILVVVFLWLGLFETPVGFQADVQSLVFVFVLFLFVLGRRSVR